jgi:hypothetical protein
MDQPKYLVVPPAAWSSLVQAATESERGRLIWRYKAGDVSWGAAYAALLNGGYRGPMDRDGFPTRKIAA